MKIGKSKWGTERKPDRELFLTVSITLGHKEVLVLAIIDVGGTDGTLRIDVYKSLFGISKARDIFCKGEKLFTLD